MFPEDRELLQVLRRQQLELQRALSDLDGQLQALESRSSNGTASVEVEARQGEELSLPPLPLEAILPPIPASSPFPAAPFLPPLPAAALAMAAPPPPPPPARPRHALEFHFGRWLTRIGAVFGIISVALILSLTHGYLFRHLGATGILGLSGLVSLGVIVLAQRLEPRKNLRLFSRSLLALGLAALYVTFYAAHGVDSVKVIQSPTLAGLLLLLWSVYVFFLSEQRNSQALAFFALALAYFSTALNPVGRFSLAADLMLAGAAVVFLLRYGWATLSYLSLFATYLALLRRLVIDQDGHLVLDTSRMLDFTPYAVYLLAAWIIFTAGVLLSRSASFRREKRIAFLTLNNGGFTFLLALAAFISGYGLRSVGWSLCWTGVLFVLTALLTNGTREGPGTGDIRRAFLAQGIAALTAGWMGLYTGVTRGIMLLVEALFLASAGAYSRSAILKVCGYVTAFAALLFLVWEITINSHHPWLLGLGGAAVMLANAWSERRHVRSSPLARHGLVLSASYYCALALGLLAAAMAVKLSDNALPPALALVALALTFSIYVLPIYELPPLAQAFLLASQVLVLFPAQTGEAMPWTTTAWVAVLTLVLLTWWSRQSVIRYGEWIVALNLVYALALVGLAYEAVRPFVGDQTWMIAASLLSVAFLIFGLVARVTSLAVMGQLFLLVSVCYFFWPDGAWTPFVWSWWAAAIPLAVVYATARALHAGVREWPWLGRTTAAWLSGVAYTYQVLALGMLVRLIFAVVPLPAQLGTFLFSGTLLLFWASRRGSTFGVRCSFVLSAIGVGLLTHEATVDPHQLVTFLNGLAVFSLLSQPTLLRHAVRVRVTAAESWILVILSAAAGWLFVSEWVMTRIHFNYLTVGWALYALFLFLFSLLVWERRQRWCALAILVVAIVRVLFSDIWGFSNGYKVLTFVVLTLITLGLGYIYARFADRLRNWL